MHLYFFPSLQPLVTVFPILLTFVGIIASLYRNKKHIWVTLVVLLLIAFGGYFFRFRQKTRDLSTFRNSNLIESKYIGLPHRPLSMGSVWDDELIVVGSSDGYVDMINLKSKQIQWSVKKSTAVLSKPHLDIDVLWVGEGLHTDERAKLSKLDLQDGMVIKEREFIGHIEAAVTLSVDRNTIFVPAGQAGLHAIDRNTLEDRWVLNGHCDSTPFVDGDRLIAVQQHPTEVTSILKVVDINNAKIFWEQNLPGLPWGNPILNDEKIFVTTGLGQLDVPSMNVSLGILVPQRKTEAWAHSVDQASHEVIWSVHFDSISVPQSTVITDMAWVIGFNDGRVAALSKETGKILWETKSGSGLVSPPVDLGDSLIGINTVDGFFVGLNIVDGKELFRYEIGGFGFTSPVRLKEGWALLSETGLSVLK